MNANLPLGNRNAPSESEISEKTEPVVRVREAVPDQHAPLTGGRLWAHRLGVLLFVFFCAVLGVVLVVFPWRDEWTSNNLLLGYPAIQDILSNGFVRGLCSGLGILDIWIGFSEAVHYRE